MGKEYERKAVHWSFIIPSFKDDDIERLSNLPSEDITYIAFAICDDDTGNRYIQGFIKMPRRCRVAYLVRLIGHGIWSVCTTPASVIHTLTEIQTRSVFKEFGELPTVITQGFRKDLASFKLAAEAGLTKDQLLVLYPTVCARYPGFVNSHIRELKQSALK
jgi:hypothetical protein